MEALGGILKKSGDMTGGAWEVLAERPFVGAIEDTNEMIDGSHFSINFFWLDSKFHCSDNTGAIWWERSDEPYGHGWVNVTNTGFFSKIGTPSG